MTIQEQPWVVYRLSCADDLLGRTPYLADRLYKTDIDITWNTSITMYTGQSDRVGQCLIMKNMNVS